MATSVSLAAQAGSAQSLTTGQRQVPSALGPPTGERVQAAENVQPALPQDPVDSARVGAAVDAINRKLEEGSQQLRFAVDGDSGKMIVRVVDTATNQVIRQIPSEVAIAISHSLEQLQGLLVRQRA
jgi:flagellar protein FlaG